MSTLNTPEEYLAAKRTAQDAALAYYRPEEGETVPLSDAEYDALMRDLEAAENEHPAWVEGEKVSEQVAAGAEVGGDVEHSVPMLSLDNLFEPEDVEAWVRRTKIEPDQAGFVVEPKMDGLAMCLRYQGGRLVQMVTRGSGTHGEDVSFAIRLLSNVPTENVQVVGPSHDAGGVATRDLRAMPFTGEVRGEVIFSHNQFAAAQVAREEHGHKTFENARNGVAGTVRGARDRAYLIPVSFLAYDLVATGRPAITRHDQTLHHLAAMGFATAHSLLGDGPVMVDAATVLAVIESFQEQATTLDYETDGLVIKVNSHSERERIGAGSKAPRWAMAYKFETEVAVSVLREVTWETGRTGNVAPRGEFDPVRIAGSTVAFATLNNPEDIARKDLMLGDHITVRKAGEVIPEVLGSLLEMRDGTQTPVTVPSECPNCGQTLDTSQARLRCPSGGGCAIEAKVAYAVSKAGWDIDGFGTTLAHGLVSSGRVASLADIFTLDADALVAGGCAAANAPKVLAQIEKAKSVPLAATITALGIRGTGRSMSRRLARHFGSLKAIQTASLEDLSAVEGIGEIKAGLIQEELSDLEATIDALRAAGVRDRDSIVATSEDEGDGQEAGASTDLPLAGKVVVVTGTMVGPLADLGRRDMEVLIEQRGGRASGSVSAKTSFVVAGEKAGSKKTKAESLGVPVLSEAEFAAMVNHD